MRKYLHSTVVELHSPKTVKFTKQQLKIDDLDALELAAETIYTAISPGTELAAYRGDPPLRPGKIYPRFVGYCNIAEVIAKGNSVSHYEIGDKILTFQSHRSAFICDEKSVITKIPDGSNLELAVTTYLFHLGYNSLLKGGLKPGHNIGVIGLGTLGLATVALGNLFGANVYGFSNLPKNLKLADRFGAHHTYKKDHKDITDILGCETKGIGLDITITTSNTWDDWLLALNLPRYGGTICVLGFPGRNQPSPNLNPLSSQFLYDKQLNIISCGYTPRIDIDPKDIRFTMSRNCEFLLNLILQNKLPADQLISTVSNWNEIEDLYKIMDERNDHFLTGVLKWK